MCTRSAHAAVSKVSSDAVLKKVLNVRRKKSREFLKDVRAINAIKLDDSHLLEGVRHHTTGSEPFFYDASYNHIRQQGRGRRGRGGEGRDRNVMNYYSMYTNTTNVSVIKYPLYIYACQMR